MTYYYCTFGENILHEHKFLLIEQKREIRQLTRKIIWNSYYMNSYESDYLFVPRQIYHKWSSIFDSFSSQVSPRSYHDFETPCTLRRRVCTIVSTDQRARSSFAFLFFFSRVYLRDRIRKQPAFSFFYHEFPDLPTFHSVHPRCSTWFDPLDGNPDRIRVICRDILALSWREDNVSICESLLLGFHGTASSFPSRLDFWEDSVKSMRDANNDVEERWKGWVIR